MKRSERNEAGGRGGIADPIITRASTAMQFLNAAGEPVTVSTSTRDDENLTEVYDAEGLIYCGHGREVCDLCGMDHRLTNELERQEGDFDEVYGRVSAAMERRQRKEDELMMRLHVAHGTGRPLTVGTTYAHNLRQEALARWGGELPPWPPLATAHSAPAVTSNVGVSSELDVLLIEGFCMVDWMADRLSGAPCDIPGVPPAWKDARITRASCWEYGELRDDRIDACRAKIESGRHRAIVVVDLSDQHALFERKLGDALKVFVSKGGVCAFPTSEGLLIAPTLKRLFGTSWTGSSYYRTTFGPLDENREHVAATFGLGNVAPFSAKACSLRNVPRAEACFAVTEDSRTESVVPVMAGRDVSRKKEPDSVTASAESLDVDVDVCVATHMFGAGMIGYFGDVNCEANTVELIASFVHSRAPRAFVAVPPSDFPPPPVAAPSGSGVAPLPKKKGKKAKNKMRWRGMGDPATSSTSPLEPNIPSVVPPLTGDRLIDRIVGIKLDEADRGTEPALTAQEIHLALIEEPEWNDPFLEYPDVKKACSKANKLLARARAAAGAASSSSAK